MCSESKLLTQVGSRFSAGMALDEELQVLLFIQLASKPFVYAFNRYSFSRQQGRQARR